MKLSDMSLLPYFEHVEGYVTNNASTNRPKNSLRANRSFPLLVHMKLNAYDSSKDGDVAGIKRCHPK